MAKRRDLKKFVKYTSSYVTSLILWEISTASDEKRPAYDQLLTDIIDLHHDIVSRISHTEPGSTKAFYKKLKTDFREGINTIIGKIDELADQKAE